MWWYGIITVEKIVNILLSWIMTHDIIRWCDEVLFVFSLTSAKWCSIITTRSHSTKVWNSAFTDCLLGIFYLSIARSDHFVPLKRGSVFPMVIWSASRMGQCRVNDHSYHAPQFIIRLSIRITDGFSIYFIINNWFWWYGPNDWTTWYVCQFRVGWNFSPEFRLYRKLMASWPHYFSIFNPQKSWTSLNASIN